MELRVMGEKKKKRECQGDRNHVREKDNRDKGETSWHQESCERIMRD